jgi:hypothetical protein
MHSPGSDCIRPAKGLKRKRERTGAAQFECRMERGGPQHQLHPPPRPWTRSQRPGPPRAVNCAPRALQTPSAGRGKPPRQLTALGEPPGHLTRRLSFRFTSLHCAAANEPLRWLAAPLRSVPLQETAETGDSPGQRITGPSSGNARYSPMRLAPRWAPLWPRSPTPNEYFSSVRSPGI